MLWHSPEASNKFTLKIVEAHAVPGSLGRLFGIGVKAAIYHGEEMLCRPEVSRYIQAVENPSWYVRHSAGVCHYSVLFCVACRSFVLFHRVAFTFSLWYSTIAIFHDSVSSLRGFSMEFDFDLRNIPQSARLCLLLHGVWANPMKVKKKNKNIRNEFPIAWVNVTLFDHRRCLRAGQMQLKVNRALIALFIRS